MAYGMSDLEPPPARTRNALTRGLCVVASVEQ